MSPLKGQYLSKEYLDPLYCAITEIARESLLIEMPHLREKYMKIMLRLCIRDMSIRLFNAFIGDRGSQLTPNEVNHVKEITEYPLFVRNFLKGKDIYRRARKMAAVVAYGYCISPRTNTDE